MRNIQEHKGDTGASSIRLNQPPKANLEINDEVPDHRGTDRWTPSIPGLLKDTAFAGAIIFVNGRVSAALDGLRGVRAQTDDNTAKINMVMEHSDDNTAKINMVMEHLGLSDENTSTEAASTVDGNKATSTTSTNYKSSQKVVGIAKQILASIKNEKMDPSLSKLKYISIKRNKVKLCDDGAEYLKSIGAGLSLMKDNTDSPTEKLLVQFAENILQEKTKSGRYDWTGWHTFKGEVLKGIVKDLASPSDEPVTKVITKSALDAIKIANNHPWGWGHDEDDFDYSKMLILEESLKLIKDNEIFPLVDREMASSAIFKKGEDPDYNIKFANTYNQGILESINNNYRSSVSKLSSKIPGLNKIL
jgi:hypothetical protein